MSLNIKNFYTCSLFLYILFFNAGKLTAHPKLLITNNPTLKIKTYKVLPDANYNFSQVLKNKNLVYVTDSLRPLKSDHYWIKLNISNPYPDNEHYLISINPLLNYTLYYFHPSKHAWVSTSAGLAFTDQRHREAGVIAITLPKQSLSTLYLKVNLLDVKTYKHAVKPEITLEKAASFENREKIIIYITLFCCIALVSFAGYNLYIYLLLKDYTYFYFVLIQVGAIIFLLSVRCYFNLLLPFRLYNIRLNTSNVVYTYDLNKFFQHVGVLLIFSGLIQITRNYLRTKEFLPSFDRLLKALLYGYILFEAVPSIVTISGLFYLDYYTIVADNFFILLIILTTIITVITAYVKKVRAAKYFLIANILPMGLSTSAAVYVILNHSSSGLLPEMAILSQMLTFGVALIARLKIIDEELRTKEIEAIQLVASIEITEYKRLLIEQENKYIMLAIKDEKDKNDLLKQKLEINQRELVSSNLHIHQKNKLLYDVEIQIGEMDVLYPHVKHSALKNIQENIKDSQYLDTEWDKFKLHFEQVHPEFFKNLLIAHPGLTKNELRLSAYFHMNLSTKEIATLLNIQPSSVKQAKARLKAKMS
ncbi:hypothetical protein LPB86_14740 [Pedobacter sp. MC2016-14]|uniref:7TMR-DISM family protein n=1 Tax=Pedobacter sp. MC2016-14 TaxID=2897327 RepID=UPI001E2F396B|nr:7TM diverse intracellular signaling domain-containing protein [Pedobacter sp. MC2016-14]MCD0489496.1 hypothetical protein [Pedobacter sp. MC2016-14]